MKTNEIFSLLIKDLSFCRIEISKLRMFINFIVYFIFWIRPSVKNKHDKDTHINDGLFQYLQACCFFSFAYAGA